jgi:predicted RNase H-like HicB family nuclease
VSVTWTADRPSQDADTLGYVVLTFKVYPEDDVFVGECVELDVSNFGDTLEEALKATLNATELYLETLDEIGERERLFKERDIEFSSSEPDGGPHALPPVPFGGAASPQRLVAVGAP